MLNNKKEVGKENLVSLQEMKIRWYKHLSVNTHTSVLFFSTEGLVYKIKAWKIPESSARFQKVNLYSIFYL